MSQSYKFSVNTSNGGYSVVIGDLLKASSFEQKRSVFLVDDKVASLHRDLLPENFISQKSTEPEKSLGTVEKIVNELRNLGSTRDTILVAIGGGIIQDLSTFVASCYMRGIDWVYCPSTLLGMVDSCIGGKSSINAYNYKNIIGNFYPPKKIIIDASFCSSLDTTQKLDGIFEAAKISFAASDKAFASYLKLVDDTGRFNNVDDLKDFIFHSLSHKKIFIEEDEFDRGARLNLNFGHTFGHAIEGASGYRISHGVAVGLGMLAALDMSQQLNPAISLNPSIHNFKKHLIHLLRLVPDLATNLQFIDENVAVTCMESDKKHTATKFKFILVSESGTLRVHELSKTKNVKTTIRGVFSRIRNLSNEI